MTIIKRARTLPFTCAEMYELVNDVERYAEFLPYFSQSIVHHRNEDEVQATLVMAVAGMSKSFTTRNRLQHNKMIEIRLVDGPFSHLEGFWQFEAVEEGCHVSFVLEFELSSRVMAMIIGPLFEQVSEQMIDAFSDRANEIYGSC